MLEDKQTTTGNRDTAALRALIEYAINEAQAHNLPMTAYVLRLAACSIDSDAGLAACAESLTATNDQKDMPSAGSHLHLLRS